MMTTNLRIHLFDLLFIVDNSLENVEVSVKRFKSNRYNSIKTSKDITRDEKHNSHVCRSLII
jgi:hypothetical protein